MNFIFILLVTAISNIFSLCIIEQGIDLKSGIRKKDPASWPSMRKYMPLKDIGGYGKNWIKVRDFEGDPHWVEKTYVTRDFYCGVIKNKPTFIRSGPGGKYRVKFKEKASHYETYKILDIQGDWVHITDIHNNTGWIERKYLWIY
ncbi:MAG: hypothetical protein JXA66_08445 [Oligoflexia bacterium]|nr:hypothetical protein [Oligoflexia bacterium]